MASKKAAPDPKTACTFKTIENLRGSAPLFQEFIKAASSYQKTAQKLSEDGKKLADVLVKISQTQQNDIGDGIGKLAELFRNLESKREVLARSLQDDLINAVQKSQKPEESEIVQFENEYKKSRDNMRSTITKLEANSKKAGKKSPDELKKAIAGLNDKIREADQMKADKLRAVLLIERKKYCNFLTQWNPVITCHVDLMNEETKFKDQESYFRTLSSSSQQLPASSEELIKSNTERTLIQLGTSGDTSYSDSYGTSYDTTYDSYDTGSQSNSFLGSSSGGQYGSSGGGYGGNSGGSGTLFSVIALYDFAGEQGGDLPFYTGEVIDVTKDDDGSGWYTGNLNGRSGIFPSSYVQRS